MAKKYYDGVFKIAIDYFADELITMCLQEAKRKKLIKDFPKIKVKEKINSELITGEKRQADTLLRLSTEKTIFIHIEYEANPRKEFNKRMWNYFRKIKNKYEVEGDVSVLPIAIIINGVAKNCFQEDVFGFSVLNFGFIVVDVKDTGFYGLIEENSTNPTTSLFLLLSFIVREKITQKSEELNNIIIRCYKILDDFKKNDKRYLTIKLDFWNAISDILKIKFGYTEDEINDLVKEKGGIKMTFSEKILKKGKQEGIKEGSLLTLKRLYEKGIITKEAYLEEIEKLRGEQNFDNPQKDN